MGLFRTLKYWVSGGKRRWFERASKKLLGQASQQGEKAAVLGHWRRLVEALAWIYLQDQATGSGFFGRAQPGGDEPARRARRRRALRPRAHPSPRRRRVSPGRGAEAAGQQRRRPRGLGTGAEARRSAAAGRLHQLDRGR